MRQPRPGNPLEGLQHKELGQQRAQTAGPGGCYNAVLLIHLQMAADACCQLELRCKMFVDIVLF